MSINIDIADRLKKLPPYLFVEIDKQKKKKRDEGRDIIDLGIGDPDRPTPDYIVKAMKKALDDPATHHYSLDSGLMKFKEAIADWYNERFGVTLDPVAEILPLIGSKEGIAHMPLAFINPGDAALVPDPCYPAYRSAITLAGGEIFDLPLLEKNGFLPDMGSVDPEVLRKTKIMFLNYPNNPTGAVCDKGSYSKIMDFTSKNDIMVCSDAAYTEMAYDGYKPGSILEVDGAKDLAVEFYSLSKTYNMTGWRVGMVCGNSKMIAGLAKVKSNMDSGVFNAIQYAGIAALKGPKSEIEELNAVYQERRDLLVDGLHSLGWEVSKPKATFYIWAKTMGGRDSAEMSKVILDEADVVVTPGSGFGKYGEGYIRMALTVPKERLEEAVARIKKIK